MTAVMQGKGGSSRPTPPPVATPLARRSAGRRSPLGRGPRSKVASVPSSPGLGNSGGRTAGQPAGCVRQASCAGWQHLAGPQNTSKRWTPHPNYRVCGTEMIKCASTCIQYFPSRHCCTHRHSCLAQHCSQPAPAIAPSTVDRGVTPHPHTRTHSSDGSKCILIFCAVKTILHTTPKIQQMSILGMRFRNSSDRKINRNMIIEWGWTC